MHVISILLLAGFGYLVASCTVLVVALFVQPCWLCEIIMESLLDTLKNYVIAANNIVA